MIILPKILLQVTDFSYSSLFISFHLLHADKTSLPSTSQDLADIFENHRMDYPFSLNVEKTFTDLTIPGVRETDFFLNSLNSMNSIPVSSSSAALLSEQMDEKISGTGDDTLAETVKMEQEASVSRGNDSNVDATVESNLNKEGGIEKDEAAGNDGRKEQGEKGSGQECLSECMHYLVRDF